MTCGETWETGTVGKRGKWGQAIGSIGSLEEAVPPRFFFVFFLVTFIDSTIHNGYFLMAGGFLGSERF